MINELQVGHFDSGNAGIDLVCDCVSFIDPY